MYFYLLMLLFDIYFENIPLSKAKRLHVFGSSLSGILETVAGSRNVYQCSNTISNKHFIRSNKTKVYGSYQWNIDDDAITGISNSLNSICVVVIYNNLVFSYMYMFGMDFMAFLIARCIIGFVKNVCWLCITLGFLQKYGVFDTF